VDVQVFLADWEIECCQPPPGVDDKVAWRLRWTDVPAGPRVVTVPCKQLRHRPPSTATGQVGTSATVA
jgi:hypothetical protein